MPVPGEPSVGWASGDLGNRVRNLASPGLRGWGECLLWRAMTDSTFDPSLYMRPPVLTIESGITLARTLVAAMPRGVPAAVKKSADRLQKAADSAQEVLIRRQREQNSLKEDDRGLDMQTDQAWRSLFGRLEHYALLPADRFAKAARAQALFSMLAPGLNEALSQPYSEQVATMDSLLQRIDDEGLAAELAVLCGPEFLDHVRSCQARYRVMVQKRLLSVGYSDSLTGQVKALGRAIVEYATRVAATVDDDDADSQARALAALRPIDNHREALAARLPTTKDPDPATPSPATPSPATPPGPVVPTP